jgi:LmbE family N-acetylglucosaminyl deacetylase
MKPNPSIGRARPAAVALQAMALAAIVAALVPTTAAAQQEPQTILAVFAHADDERIVGPLLSRYAAAGHEVLLVIATDGRKGVRDFVGIPAGDSLAAIRAGEVRCAAERLGIRPPILLGLEDAGLASFTALGRLRTELRRIFAEHSPDVVITFGPEGGTGHPDHRLVGAVTTEVYQAGGAGWPRALYFPSLPSERMKDAPAARTTIGTVPAELLPVRVPFGPAELEATRQAFACHATQYSPEEQAGVMRYLEHGWDGTVYLRPFGGSTAARSDIVQNAP